jgi:hypothetical protein
MRTLSCRLCPAPCSASTLGREGSDEKIYGVVYGFRGCVLGNDEKLHSLVDWWASVTGKLPAPCVYAKRLTGHPAIVIGRQGDFISLAVALFCEIDQFNESEVISTVTNVHEDYLRRTKAATKTAR